jgi:ABC-type glycerol-3-phosphate transport system substrate-binding protein
MALKNKVNLIAANLLVGLLAFSVTGCGGKNNNSTNGGTSSGGDETVDVLSQITNDLELVDGEPLFDEEVEITIWSINGDPDKAVQERLFAQFNDVFLGQINLKWNHIGHFDYYNNLDTTWATDRESIPDILFMHNEKTIEYAAKEFIWPLDQLVGETTGVNFDFSQTYSNIDRVNQYKGSRYAIPVDAHGFLTSFRQDIIKKNGLGFENNTRFIPESKAEYEQLLQALRDKADANDLWIRDINKGSDHSWKKANPGAFYPSFMQSTDPDGLSALYANGGSLVSEDQSTVTYHQNKGLQAYVTDQVDRYNNRLMGDGTSTALFGVGNTVMFSEGPWYVSQQYDGMYNNSELSRVGLGVTEEDANDPVYSKPYVASHPRDWWTLEENMDTDTAGKWYGNGHSISITRECKSLKTIAAALVFAHWYTQEMDINDEKHNLTTWCSSGHIPAWRNVYESEDYVAECAENMTLRALGNPEDIIAMEGLAEETTIFNSLTGAIAAVQTEIRGGTATRESALKIMNDSADSLQAMLDMLSMEDL